MEIKYLFIGMKYPAYIKLQTTLLIGWIAASALFFFFGPSAGSWPLRNAWWLCLALAVVELLETLIAVRFAKKKYDEQKSIGT